MTEAKAADTTEPAVRGLKLPDPKSFDRSAKTVAGDGPDPGTVLGLDYGKWAAAIVDLTDKPNRVEENRARLVAKGYKSAGEGQVVGFRSAEVWVKPRDMHDAAIRAKRQQVVAHVRSRRLSDTALLRPVVKMVDPKNPGVEIPVE